MKYKKIIINILIITAAFLLFILWNNKNNTNSVLTSAPQNKDLKIYLITKDKSVEYWYNMNDGALKMANLLGVTYQWEAPEEINTEQQIEILNRAVDEGAMAILIASNDPIRLSEPIKNAKEKGVKIIYVDDPAEEEAIITLATDNYKAGRVAGENMLLELELLGLEEGKVGIVSVSLSNNATMERERGFRDILNGDGRFTLINTAYTLGEPLASQTAATQMIERYPDLVGLFGTNQGSSEGVGNAIKADNNRIVGIGFDKSKNNLSLLHEGSLKAIVDQNPFSMGYFGMAQAFAALKGFDTGPPFINTGVSILRER